MKKRLSTKKRLALTSGATAVSTVLAAISQSFANKAFAECWAQSNGWGCTNVTISCLPENSTESVTATLEGGYTANFEQGDGMGAYPLYAEAYETTDVGLTFSPSQAYFNNYDGTTIPFPDQYYGDGEVSFTTQITTPEINVPYRNASVNFYSMYTNPDGWDSLWTDMDAVRNFRVENVNAAPTIQNTLTGVNGNNIEVETTVRDEEGNSVNVVFELSDQSDFSNILQSHTYNNLVLSPDGTKLTHNFTSLNDGVYHWRAIITETNAIGTCTNTPNAIQPINYTRQTSTTEVSVGNNTSITGTLFLDYDKDNVRDADEPGAGRVTLNFDSNGFMVSVETTNDTNASFSTEMDPGTINLYVDGTDPDIPVGYVYNGPTQFNVTPGQVNNLGDLPMISNVEPTIIPTPPTEEPLAHLSFDTCLVPETNEFRLSFQANYVPGEYRVVGQNTGFTLHLGHLEVGEQGGGFEAENTTYILPHEDTWIKQWFNGTRWQRAGGLPVTDIEEHIAEGWICPTANTTTTPTPTTTVAPTIIVVGQPTPTTIPNGGGGNVLGSTLSPTGIDVSLVIGLSVIALTTAFAALIRNTFKVKLT